MDTVEIEDDETTPTDTKKRRKTNGVGADLPPVLPDDSGNGPPYAPDDWPDPGDVWGWRVGKRIAFTGHFLDRYLYLPVRLRTREFSSRKKYGFASKLAVERYIRSAFPEADVDAFFSSFSWKIPAKQPTFTASLEGRAFLPPPSEEITEDTLVDSHSDSAVVCKARNKKCSSLVVEAENPPSAAMPCDICCTEPRFCRDCCCILCCKTVSSSNGGYSYIKCEAVVDEDYICGHVAHLNCALRAYMAGTVGGSIGLETEYYCRRCDVRTDLIPHVMKLLQTCESVDSHDETEKMLNLGICLLRGSERTDVKRLLNRIESAYLKLKHGTVVKDIWKEDERVSSISTDDVDDPRETTTYQDFSSSTTSSPDIPSASSHSLQLEEEIDQVLQELQKSQEIEFSLAEERLQAHKKYLQNLYQQLDKEKSVLLSQTSKANRNGLKTAVSSRVDQIRRELMKLKDMESVANGFGRTPRTVLREHFGVEIVD